jgi:hypothetical protein
MDPDCASEEGNAIIRKNSRASRGQFFSISLDTLDSVVRAGAQAESVLGYIVLSLHTKGKGSNAGKFTAAVHMPLLLVLTNGGPRRCASHWANSPERRTHPRRDGRT